MLLVAVAGWEFSSAGVRVVSMSSGPAAAPPVTQKREFWVLMGYAVALGVFGAVAGLVFIGVIKLRGQVVQTIPIRAGSAGIGGGWRSPRRPVPWSGCCAV